MKMRYQWLLAVMLLLCACGKEQTAEKASPRNVYVITPEEEGAGGSRTFTGVVEEKSELSVGFKTAGQIKQVMVKEGQHVGQGQLLARLDDVDYRLGVDAVQIQYDQLKGELERAKKLFEKKSMTANDYDKAVSGLRQLGVQLQANKNKLAYTRLYAPCSGVVESVNFSAGEMVDAGTAVFTMLDMSQKTVNVDIPASVYVNRDAIREITCVSGHNPEEQWRMRILSIVPKADSNQLYRMKLGFASGGATVTPGMNVEVEMLFNGTGDAKVTLPQSALFRKNGKEYVWIVNQDSTVKMCQVEINPVGAGAEVEIVSGLPADAQVVRAGVRMLHDGEKVNVIGSPTATNVGGML